MKTISKFLLFGLILLLVSLGAVSAAENTANTTADTTLELEITADVTQDTSSKVIEDTTTESNIIPNDKTIEKNRDVNPVKEARTTTVINETVNEFFTNNVTTTALIGSGDTINLKGTFYNFNFILDKPITLTSFDNDATLYNCMIHVKTTGSGSTVSNLVIENSEQGFTGIAINCANNIIIENNDVRVNGTFAHAFDAVTNNSVIRSNYFQTTKTTNEQRTHTAMVFCSSNYNVIANNTVLSDNANCIYLSTYPGQTGLGHGGSSNYNNITGNNVTGANSGWSYPIQMMGSNNIASYNNVSGGYWGISSAALNNTIDHNYVDAWARGISTSNGTLVTNNTVHVSANATGIYIDNDNNKILDNEIVTESGVGIDITANNVNITGNTITTNDSYGIYSLPSTGSLSTVYIVNNRITSSKEGIYITKQGLSKFVNDIFVDNNNIVSDSTYAVNLRDAGGRTASETNVTVTSSNILRSANGTGNAAYLPPSKSNGTTDLDTDQVINITSIDVYNQYFDNTGVANSEVKQNATVYINTVLDNKNLIFTKKAHVIGQNGAINNGTVTFSGSAHASTVTNLKITNTENETYNVHGIELLEVNNCILTNNTIKNFGKYESFGIFVFTSGGNTITSNNITTSGDYVNNGLMLFESTTNTIENNTIHVNQSNVKYGYSNSVQFDDKIGTVQEVLHNHGIMLLYSSYNTINNNTVTSKSMFDAYEEPTNNCKNSIVGIDLYFDCHSNQVTNNTVNIDSYGPYTYGMGVLGAQWNTDLSKINAKNNLFQNNDVTVKGGYFATGFIAGRNSIYTNINSNTFNVDARKNATMKGDYAYGITLENSTTSTVTNNQLTLNGSAAYSMELYSSENNTITLNTITAKASYPYGIAGADSRNNQILNNTITLTQTNVGTVNPAGHSDSIPLGEEGIMFTYESSNNNIMYNTIKTNTNATVRITGDCANNNVTENSLVSKSKVGDTSVTNEHSSNIVRNNFVYFVNITVDALTAKIGETVNLTAHVFTTTNDVSNLTVAFKIGSTEVGTAKVSNGKSTLSYTIPTYFNPTTYQITASVRGNNFQNATNNNRANIGKDPEEITVKVNKVLAAVGTDTTLTASLTTGVGGKIGSGQAEFYVDDTLIDTVDVRLGSASVNYTAGSTSGVHIIKVKYLGTSDYAPAEANNTLGIQTKSSVSVANATGKLGETVNIVANVTSDGNNVTNGIVHIYIGSHNVANASITNGKVNCNYVIANSFTKNTYNLRVEFDGNDTLTSASGTAKITVNPYTTVFSYNTTTAIVGEKVSLVLGISNNKTGSNYYAANDGNVSIKLNGQPLTDSSGNEIVGNVKDGLISFNFTAPEQMIGSHNITFTYSGNTKFDNLTKTYINGLIINSNTTPTTITIDSLSPTKYGNNVTITGTLKDRDNILLKNMQIKLSINSNTITTTTNNNGVFTYTTTASTMGTNNVKANFTGNSNYDPSSAETTFLVNKQDTTISIDSIKTDSDNVTITGTLKDANGNAIKNAQIALTVNTNTFSVTTNTNGAYTYTGTATLSDTNNASATYAGSSTYAASNYNTTFTKNILDTKITINPIQAVIYGRNITITGTLSDKNNNIVKNMPVTMTLNSEEINLTTNSNGVYSYKCVTPTAGQNNITVSYAGNKDYNPCTATATFTVNKQNLNITINPIQSVVYGHNVTITGRFIDGDGNIRANSSLRITINGKNITTKTNNKGEFTVTSKVGVVGTNNVTATHNGDKNYNPTETTSTFTMNKQNLIITVNPIKTTSYGNNVTITGRFVDGDGNARANNDIKININGKSLTATTDKNGYYTYTTSIGKVGTNNVTLSHAGGANYNPTEITTTYEVVKQDLKITLDPLGTVPYGAVTITGRLTDGLGNPRVNTGVKLLINGKSATAKTDTNGYFSFTTKAVKVGVNNITASHNGGGNYNPTSTNATFIMVKKDLKITVDPIATVTYGDSVTITGTFTDGDGNIRANSNLKVIINGKTLTAKTDANGRFTATSKVGSVGINNVTVAHSGGTGFNPTSTNTTFTMIKQDLVININPISSVKQGSTVTITGNFTDANGKIRANTNLKISINGKETTTKTNSNGVFTYTTTATTKGTNNVTVSHAGGTNYNPASKSATFKVS